MKTIKTYLSVSVFLLISFVSFADDVGGFTRSEYIEMWKDEAVYQMVVNRIPASVTLAQGILESGNGNSSLAKNANNHFGIKCHSSWDGMKVYHDDDKKGECFRHYVSAKESFEDHSIFLKQRRYLSLYDLDIMDYKKWCKGLKKAGYATDPNYAKRLIDLIENNNLKQYDQLGLRMIENGDSPIRDEDKEPIAGNRPELEKTENEDLPAEISIKAKRAIRTTKNNVPYIIADSGDDIASVALDLELMPWQIRKYNDLSKDAKFISGQKVYIKPKRSRASTEWHIVEQDQTMWDISQLYGVKLNKLLKKNGMTSGDEPVLGDKISLRSRLK